MCHTTHGLDERTRRQRRQMLNLARQFERGASVARRAGNPAFVEAERNARSLRFGADILRRRTRED